jgi:hypothetical protein
VEMVLLDWTRMARSYCLAGVVLDRGAYRVVRPLLARYREAPVRNVGWSAYLLDGHTRWEVFELIGVQPAGPEPPHLEDLWVRALKPCRRLASGDQRRAILAATTPQPGAQLFGAELQCTRTAAYLNPGTGQKSLTTLVVPMAQLTFAGSRRAGAAAVDFRATIPIPGIGQRWLPVKDHHLLRQIESATMSVEQQCQQLREVVQKMGQHVAIRLGLSRPFQSAPGQAQAACWLMADGFFSLSDPQV